MILAWRIYSLIVAIKQKGKRKLLYKLEILLFIKRIRRFYRTAIFPGGGWTIEQELLLLLKYCSGLLKRGLQLAYMRQAQLMKKQTWEAPILRLQELNRRWLLHVMLPLPRIIRG